MTDYIQTSHGRLPGRPPQQPQDQRDFGPRVARLDDRSNAIDTTIRVLADRQIGIGEEAFDALVHEREVHRAHRNHLQELSEQTKFGSATGEHGALLADWLISRGWTPPTSVVLYVDEELAT
ncbi:hypothetical protein PP485_gp57 [Gordonia phage ThankyouJordi]|uniref:Uncharacterized protein n=1 Tax=Gordonia phage ThankyouJordi TaxID=2571252 RepID=A0A4Y6EGH9_9CAUD|nr:hypothetical protein PP485_gp57 [Gordonia phage ThankyouJordi]QCW22242.1 hypothetical protein SEA_WELCOMEAYANNA_57 [Gordonia phage WelcomeAyanna]QDF17818.1 hypothetical protein SEA_THANKYOUJORDI_57 [Gordonia phage ThankyouJordi]